MDTREDFYDDTPDLVDLSDEDKSSRFFSDLLTRSESSLSAAVNKIDTSVRIWAHQASMKDDNAVSLLRCHLPTVLRLSLECPSDEVRSCFVKLLHDLEEHGTPVPKPVVLGPSAFIPSTEVQAIDTDVEEVARLFQDAFVYNCRISHITQVMGDHPAYLDCHIRAQHYLMLGDGSLPFEWRAILGVMAAARHRCGPLVRLMLKNFVDLDGNESWLKGIDYLPEKLKNLLTINKILAHQPWLITHNHIQELLKPGPNSWSMGELVHALVILAHWHAMAGFSFGCGINPELDMPEGHTYTIGDTSKSESTLTTGQETRSQQAGATNTGVGNGAAACETLPSPLSSEGNGADFGSNNKEGMCAVGKDIGDLAEKMKGIQETDDGEEETSESCQMDQFQQIHVCSDNGDAKTDTSPCPEFISPFLDDPTFCHENFSQRGSQSGIRPFRLHDYCWEDHGFSLVNRLYSDIGPLLDAKFSCVSTLTYNKVGDLENIDTSTFRQAIFNYIHCIKGLFHDDYNYKEVNELLGRDFKSYVRKVTCFPESVTAADFLCLEMFKPSERVHINFLLLEARLQAELLYALRALNIYITMRS